MQSLSTNQITNELNLHEAQFDIFIDPSRFKVLVAGRRWGKTRLAITACIYHALNKKAKVWVICPTYKQAEMIAWKLIQEMLPSEVINKKNEVKLTLELINGSEISLKGAENEDNLRGVGLNFCILDEYAQMKPNVWHEIVRPMLIDTQGQALFIGTPKGKNSLYELYLKGQREEDGFKSWQFKTESNPYIEPHEIELARKESPDRYFKQEYEASFEDYVGLIYPEFKDYHIIDVGYIPEFYKRIAAIDPAISGTTCCLKAYMDEDGVMIIYDEFYKQNVRVDEVCNEIKDEKIDKWLIDPSAQAKTQVKEGKLLSLYDEFLEHGISVNPAESDVEAGINRTGEHFKTNRIKIASNCVNLINELERYRWADERETVNGVMKAKPYKKLDHAVDCLRYLIMSQTDKTELDYQPTAAYHSPLAHLNRDRAKRGQTSLR